LFDRDCPIQRRYQKLIEEVSSLFLSEKLSNEIGNAAIKIVKKCKYQNAGTVEFWVDKHDNCYFIEMNARIAVEHGITEEMTDIDLVKWQLLLAAGEKLTIDQKDVKINTHAFECSFNAEDPIRNFGPCLDEIAQYHPPGGQGIRVDYHAYSGYTIPPYYNSMSAKLIASGKTRGPAIKKCIEH
jgi:acetyl-CoA carboxylase biotin carboxylase subunit